MVADCRRVVDNPVSRLAKPFNFDFHNIIRLDWAAVGGRAQKQDIAGLKCYCAHNICD
jgi:hypothetical protein